MLPFSEIWLFRGFLALATLVYVVSLIVMWRWPESPKRIAEFMLHAAGADEADLDSIETKNNPFGLLLLGVGLAAGWVMLEVYFVDLLASP
ncbi:MAG: hypothetical protein AAFX76_12265 [Planctomycetota bacterium]